MTEIEALKAALVEAEGKAVKELLTRKRLKARVNEVQQELHDAVRKCDTLEHNGRLKKPNSPRLVRVRRQPGVKPRAPSRRSRRPGISRWVRHSI